MRENLGAVGDYLVFAERAEAYAFSKQTEKLLKRLRQTIPIPVPVEEVYFGCFPPQIKTMVRAGLFDRVSPGVDVLTQNFANIVSVSDPAKGGGVVEFNLEGSSEDREFWLRVPRAVPVGEEDIVVSQTHPHFNSLRVWMKAVTALETRIGAGIQFASRMEQAVQFRLNTSHLRFAWPEVLHLVKITNKGGMTKAEERKLCEFVNCQAQKDEFLSMMNSATLLEEKKLTAWMGYTGVGDGEA